MNTLNVGYRKVEALIPCARNPRTHAESQIVKITTSIVEYDWTNPILIDGGSGIIAGHGRLAAACKLGLGRVPVIELAHLTITQKRALVVASNRLALDTGWGKEMLALELVELSDTGYDLALTDFGEAEIEALLTGAMAVADGESESKVDESDMADDVLRIPAMAVSRPNDIWTIGSHHLIYDDAIDRDVIAASMQGDTTRLCFIPPPYGNQRDYTFGGIADQDGLMRGMFMHLPTAGDGQVLINLGLVHRGDGVIPYQGAWLGWMRQQGWWRFAWYVWDQGPGMSDDWAGRFVPDFEFVFCFSRESHKPNRIVPCRYADQGSHLHVDGSSTTMHGKGGEVGDWTHKGLPTQDTRIPGSVIHVIRHRDKIGQDIGHPAVFPMALPEFVIETYTDAGDIMFEPFGGSGTTILAAERTGRICYSVEIAPQYVGVATKRFQQSHPGIPVTLIAVGQSFGQVAVECATIPDAEVVT